MLILLLLLLVVFIEVYVDEVMIGNEIIIFLGSKVMNRYFFKCL